jgi:phosphoglucomutase
MNNILDKAKIWTKAPFDQETQQAVQKLIDENQYQDAFYTDLEFGTGGLRGIMGLGTARINAYTLGQTTQGLANYLQAKYPNAPIKVAICYDSRNNSAHFADLVSSVLSANGIAVLCSPAARPTPMLSFLVRHENAQAGIVITASHNPKEYNGYKVYASDGAQMVPPDDKILIQAVRAVQLENIAWQKNAGLIQYTDASHDEAYLASILSLCPVETKSKKDIKITYTPLHGSGITLLPKLLAKAGFAHLDIVQAQADLNGDFPTVSYPNPEETEAMKMALLQAEKNQSDLVFGTDPDADRLGVAVRNNEGNLELLNGNQIACLLAYYILSSKREAGNLPENGFLCKTIVTTELLTEIAHYFGVEMVQTLTGFKWIAEQIRLREGKQIYLFGGEESYGYLTGDKVRDKDALSSAFLFAEMAVWAKEQGKTVYDLLLEIYQKIGSFWEDLVSLTLQGQEGAKEIQEMMQNMRQNPPKVLAGEKVLQTKDYQNQTVLDENGQITAHLNLPKSDVLQFFLQDGSVLTVRPSGTEPKIKFYCSAKLGKLVAVTDYKNNQEILLQKIKNFISSFRNL